MMRHESLTSDERALFERVRRSTLSHNYAAAESEGIGISDKRAAALAVDADNSAMLAVDVFRSGFRSRGLTWTRSQIRRLQALGLDARGVTHHDPIGFRAFCRQCRA